MEGQGAKEWYSNKELYEMMVGLSKGLEKTSAELEKTQVLIRDYNGLREIVNECRDWQIRYDAEAQGEERQCQKTEERSKFNWERIGYIVGIAGLGIAGLALIVK